MHCHHAYNPFCNIGPALWLANALKKSRAVPAEIIAGRRQIKPSRKAKRAAGIYSSDEEESENEPPIAGSKRKADKKASSTIKKQKLNDTPIAKTKHGQAHKSAHVDSEDIESTDDNAGHTEDQADAYERLRLERETDRPVRGEIIIGNSLTKSFRSKKSAVLVAMIHILSMSAPSSRPTCVLCQITPSRRAIGVRFASKSISCAYLMHFLTLTITII